jgi:hypothetical protein
VHTDAVSLVNEMRQWNLAFDLQSSTLFHLYQILRGYATFLQMGFVLLTDLEVNARGERAGAVGERPGVPFT